jgi:hypothetical protein
MTFLSPTSRHRFNEVTGVVLLSAAVLLWLSLLSYQVQDASWNTANGLTRPHNLIGPLGAHLADFGLQAFGLAAFILPVLLIVLAWKWVRSETLEAPGVKFFGAALFVFSTAVLVSLIPGWRLYSGTVPAGGLAGTLLAGALESAMNVTGAAVLAATCLIASLYLVSTFSFATCREWTGGAARAMAPLSERWSAWRERRRARASSQSSQTQ